MIKCNFSKILGEKKLRVADVVRGTEVPRNTLASLYYETAKRVDLDVIDRLCGFLDCDVSDLFERIPGGIRKTRGLPVSRKKGTGTGRRDIQRT